MNYNKTTLNKILEDLIDSKVPGEEDLIPEAFPDYEDLNYLKELKRKKRSVVNSNPNVFPISNIAKAVFRHFKANKEGIELARSAIKLAGVINDALVSSREVTPDKIKVIRAAVNVTGALDKEFCFVDTVIANNKVLSKALKEVRETGKDIDALYAAANADVITNMRRGPVSFWIDDKR